NVSFSMEEPVSWETLPGLADFSGEGVYSCRFAPERRPLSATLRLERLSCTCAVYVNGEHAGDIWTHPYELDITKFLREGENALELRVASTLVNEMRAGDPEWPRFDTSIPDWPYYGKIINDQRKARLNTRREHEEQLEPLKSGVWGGVTLEYSR
ncbi:MAG: hypothetical protein IK080_05530, partial [Clostridia bacterium]|nr:hypothetical protein [Clostridia bacterium]